MKKIIVGLVLTVLLAANAFSGPFKLVKDDLPKDHLFNKTRLMVNLLSKQGFADLKMYTRKATVEDEDLTDAEKKEIISEVESLEFKPKQFFYYTMVYNSPFLDEEIDITFQLVDAQNNELIEDVRLFKNKILMITEYGSSMSYNYSWIISSKKQLTKKVIGKESTPINLIVTYPDGKQRVYKVKI